LNPQAISTKKQLAARISATLLVGIGAGCSGLLLVLLLHFIQHLAYGYGNTLHPENFLQGVTHASGARRFTALVFCALFAGIGWWAIYRFGKPLVSIQDAIKSKKPDMPKGTTVLHALLQIITVGLGSPLGREVAPREMGAVFACFIAEKWGLSLKDTRILVACGAGAGLAAVYNVPLGGTFFILEVLLSTLEWPAIFSALCTCALATVISWIGLGNESQYQLTHYTLDASIVVWSILVSPVFGIFAYYFREITDEARKNAPRNGQVLVLCFLNFLFIGLLALYFPALLGNGKGPIELGFSDNLGIDLATTLIILRVLIVWSSLRAGAHGGLLTPSLANGVLLAIILGSLWNTFWPGTHTGAFAVVGAAAFLAAAQKMPLTAIVLTAEFTNIDFNFLVPVLFAVLGATATASLFEKYRQETLNYVV
jgi:H+/Cl- antiporter ClcA